MYVLNMASTDAFLNRGEIVANRYRIDKLLGEGGMGVVFRAIHIGTDQVVALKLLHPRLVRDPKVRAMFDREARVGARIKKNPHMVNVFDTGIDSRHGVAYIAMEYLHGMTLEDYVHGVGPMAPPLLLTLWWQLSNVLTQAHAAGVIHRDLKPSNLFLTLDHKNQPRLVVLDFGIAKLLNSNVESPVTPVGTPAYAAPEQRGLIGNSPISAATDLWAIGIITYELLSGKHPDSLWQLRGTYKTDGSATTDPTTLAISDACQASKHLPPGFDVWLSKSLAEKPENRWTGAEDAIRALSNLFDGDQLLAEQQVPQTLIVIPIATQPSQRNRNIRHHRNNKSRRHYASTKKQSETTVERHSLATSIAHLLCARSAPAFLALGSVVVMLTLKSSSTNSTINEKYSVEENAPTAKSVNARPDAIRPKEHTNALAGIPARGSMVLNDDADTDDNKATNSPLGSSNADATIKFVSSTKCALIVDGKSAGYAPSEMNVTSSRLHEITIFCDPGHRGYCLMTPNPKTTTTLEITDPMRQFDKSHRIEDCAIWKKDP